MKKIKSLILSAAFLLLPFLGNSQEAPKETSKKPLIRNVTANSTLASKYLGTYGFTLSEGAVQQSSLGFDAGKLSYSFWKNFDHESGRINELNNKVSFPLKTEKLGITPSALWYTFPGTGLNDAYEIGATINSRGLPLDLTLYGNQAFDSDGKDKGRLVHLTAGKTWNLNRKKTVSLRLEGNTALHNRYFTGKTGVSHVQGKAALTWRLNDRTSISGSLRTQKVIKRVGKPFKDESLVGAIRFQRSFR